MSAHPLSRKDDWFFSQHQVQVHAPIYRVKTSNKQGFGNRKLMINGRDSCREGVLSQLRRDISRYCGQIRTVAPERMWNKRWYQEASVDLERPILRRPGESFVAVHAAHMTFNLMKDNPHYMPVGQRRRARRRYGYYYEHSPINQRDKRIRVGKSVPLTDTMVQDYLNVCDAVVGPLTVLLNPDRYQGDWWYTTVAESKEGSRNMLRWYGVDNTCVAHPALASLYSGLVRQCAYIARAGCADQVLSDVEGLGLEECLNESDDVQALRIVKKMRRWIAVPRLKGGHGSNIPVATGTMPKIFALHKSIYAYGFEKTFGATFLNGWGAGRPPGHYEVNGTGGAAHNGIHSYMGAAGTNKEGNRIKRLAEKAA
jgi:hypothetical protein